MKKIAVLISLVSLCHGQIVIDFENLALPQNSAYSPTTSTPFQASGVKFSHVYSSGFWLGGFSYTNKYDSSDGSYNNLYGVIPYKGRNNSLIYTVAQYTGVITMTAAQQTLSGFYVTNTTYAYKTIRDGGAFSRKFGDTTGTGSGTTIPQGQYPDYFKLIIRAWKNGSIKQDSATFYLADYRTSNKQIVKDWQYLSTANLGDADSLTFSLRSTDNGSFGMNTPAFFAIDDVQIQLPNPVSVQNENTVASLAVWPQPFSTSISVTGTGTCTLRLFDENMRLVKQADADSLSGLGDISPGIYLLSVSTASGERMLKVIKE